MFSRIGIGILTASLAFPLSARADEVVLTDGEKIEGIVSEDGDDVVIQLDIGMISFPKSEVQAINKSPSALETLLAKRQKLGAADANGRYQLGVWAEQRGLSAQAHGLFAEAVGIDPNHRGARLALGYRQQNGAWIDEETYMTQTGHVRHLGAWVSRDVVAAEEAKERAALDAREDKIREERLARLEEELRESRAAQREALQENRRQRRQAQDDENDDFNSAYLPLFGFPVWGGGAQRYGTPTPGRPTYVPGGAIPQP